MKLKVLLLSLFSTSVLADITLNSMQREILKLGLHRELITNITYTVTNPYDIGYCSFVVRENITKDHYIYYEEVTRDMPGF